MYLGRLLTGVTGIKTAHIEPEVNLRTLLQYYLVPDFKEILYAVGHPWRPVKGKHRIVFYCTKRKNNTPQQSFRDADLVNKFLLDAKEKELDVLLIVRGSLVFREVKNCSKVAVRVFRNNYGYIGETLIR